MEMLGEKFIFGFDGTTVDASVEEMIAERRIGGVVLFSRNVKNARQIAALCSELQSIRKRVSELPLIIAVDQEGGGVNRIADGATHFPSPMAIAATGDAGFAGRVGYAMGCQLVRLGINMNFAPVLDVNIGKRNPIIGVRSFGDEPERVAAFGAAMIGGMERAGIASVAKHFPGLGSAERDPHLETLVISRNADELTRNDLVPFASAVDAGVSGIMIGHASYPAFSGDPASLSEEIVQGLLRRQLRFGGLAITDDLEMGAVGERRTIGDVATRSLCAGMDLLLICHSRVEQLAAMTGVAEALKSGRVPTGTIEDGAARIRVFRDKLLGRVSSSRADAIDEGEELAREVAERAITCVSDMEKILPLRRKPGERLLVVSPALGPLTAVEEGETPGNAFIDSIRALYPVTDSVSFELVPSRDDFGKVLKAIDGAHVIVMGTCNAHLYHEQTRLVKEVAGAGKPTVFVALKNPYDVDLYPYSAARLAAYGSDKHTLAALARVIFGELAPQGKLPVALEVKNSP